MSFEQSVISAIDASPLNRGLSGAEWIANAGNIPVMIGDDIALFDDEGDRTFQVHFLFQSRGKAAVASAKDAFRQMFEIYTADLIFGLVPEFRRDVKMLARLVGGKSAGLRQTDEGLCELFVLSKEMWSEKCPS
jgi:hypothetical protein